LIKWSIARDLLDLLIVGQLPGVGALLDLPLIIMHFDYAGPAAAVTLLEAIPVVGLLPIFTIMALCYPNHDDQPPPSAAVNLEPQG
jgi:hypothetical protein